MPAPMIAPMPSATRLTAERLRSSGTPVCAVEFPASGFAASASNAAIDLRAKICATAITLSGICRKTRQEKQQTKAIFVAGFDSLPRHQRGVNDIRQAVAADRSDGEVDVVEPEPVRGDEFERKAL